MKTLASTRTGHCPAGIFKNKISNVTKNEEAGHGPVPCPFIPVSYGIYTLYKVQLSIAALILLSLM